MAKKRKTKARKTSKLKTSEVKRKRDEAEKLKLPHGVISGAYAGLTEQLHADGYDEQRLAKRKTKKRKRKVAKKKAAPKRKVRRKK